MKTKHELAAAIIKGTETEVTLIPGLVLVKWSLSNLLNIKPLSMVRIRIVHENQA